MTEVGGNTKSKEIWEAKVPPCWKRLSPEDTLLVIHYKMTLQRYLLFFFCPLSLSVCRDQWIRAKYERKEFAKDADDSKKQYLTGRIFIG